MYRPWSTILAALVSLLAVGHVDAFDITRNDNLVVYWGQNSYGATHSDQANWQKPLADYCQDDTINVINLAFLHVFFSTGGLPQIDFANTCSSAQFPVFAGTSLANCQFLEDDIKTCQARGKIILLSLGGATGAASFTSDSQAQTFATTIWNLFMEGSSSTRPFGGAILDGIDLDIEGGSSSGFSAFAQKFRSLASGSSKRYYLTAAPQCPYPDAYMSPVLNAVGFDAVFVQFYNNYCGLTNYNNANAWNFQQWDTWAKTVSPNPNVKIFIGAPAAPSAAGSGYVDSTTLGNIARQTRSSYSSFGGVMLWDVSQAYGNNRFDIGIKNGLTGGSSVPTSTMTSTRSTTLPSSTSTRTTSTSSAPTSTSAPGSCSGVGSWSSTTTYNGGNYAVYNGHLWMAQWWTYNDVPGGPAGVWLDKGACFNFASISQASATNTETTPGATMFGTDSASGLAVSGLVSTDAVAPTPDATTDGSNAAPTPYATDASPTPDASGDSSDGAPQSTDPPEAGADPTSATPAATEVSMTAAIATPTPDGTQVDPNNTGTSTADSSPEMPNPGFAGPDASQVSTDQTPDATSASIYDTMTIPQVTQAPTTAANATQASAVGQTTTPDPTQTNLDDGDDTPVADGTQSNADSGPTAAASTQVGDDNSTPTPATTVPDTESWRRRNMRIARGGK